MSIYKGTFSTANWYQVTKDDKEFSPVPSQKLYNHSPDGFAWGYNGSGPAQLALALLLDITGDSKLSLTHYQQFKRDVVSMFYKDKFEITSKQIVNWLINTISRQKDINYALA